MVQEREVVRFATPPIPHENDGLSRAGRGDGLKGTLNVGREASWLIVTTEERWPFAMLERSGRVASSFDPKGPKVVDFEADTNLVISEDNVPGRIRTCNFRLRRPVIRGR
jgi:hypothetical protein